MMRNTFAARLFLFSMLGVGLDVATGAVATAAEAPQAVAHVAVGPGLLEWTPLVESEGTTLAIADPQGVVRAHHFAPGEAPALSLFDAQGAPLPDGTYTWEIRVTPRDTVPERGLGRLGRVVAPLVQSGYFTVSNGAVITPDLVEPIDGRQSSDPSKNLSRTTAADQMVPDDLIVDGKGCIGLGCANNEAFGVETLRLKQSVVRLRFHDTSAGAGLPSTDWQITANDSASGGANRFSIEDLDSGTTPMTIMGGAPTSSLHVGATGRLGLGTATPAERLHVLESANANTIITSENASTGANAAGGLRAKSNAASVSLQAHGGGGSSTGFGQPLASWAELLQATGNGLIIGTVADKPLILGTNNTNRIHIAPNGKVGIGTANPTGNLHLFGQATDDVFEGMGVDLNTGPAFNYGYAGNSFGRSAGFFNIRPDASAVAPNPSLRFLTSNVQRMIIDNEGFIGLGVANPTSPIHHSSGAILTAGGTWQNASSRDSKQNVAELAADEALAALEGLAPVKFAYKVDPNERHVGFIAEEVPDLVASPDRKTLSPMDVVAVLTRVVQEQQVQIAELRRQLEQLRTDRP